MAVELEEALASGAMAPPPSTGATAASSVPVSMPNSRAPAPARLRGKYMRTAITRGFPESVTAWAKMQGCLTLRQISHSHASRVLAPPWHASKEEKGRAERRRLWTGRDGRRRRKRTPPPTILHGAVPLPLRERGAGRSAQRQRRREAPGGAGRRGARVRGVLGPPHTPLGRGGSLGARWRQLASTGLHPLSLTYMHRAAARVTHTTQARHTRTHVHAETGMRPQACRVSIDSMCPCL